jgi:hypothetical protein
MRLEPEAEDDRLTKGPEDFGSKRDRHSVLHVGAMSEENRVWMRPFL